ncbi:hypothetical protein DPEC_G00299450 [Dallia pectoralis]|uniref:Uncharacterized protein n=1 Tax=Dallia pectoralis TaxID=75939 RepID=A0ACC2FG52_DALPE|nr:hypothetical protein DPEC_G00299450 [Dallia pectoralis]
MDQATGDELGGRGRAKERHLSGTSGCSSFSPEGQAADLDGRWAAIDLTDRSERKPRPPTEVVCGPPPPGGQLSVQKHQKRVRRRSDRVNATLIGSI